MKLERLRSADYKAPGGKLVRVRLKEEQGQIRSVKITGDFFLVPEESLGKLEKMLEERAKWTGAIKEEMAENAKNSCERLETIRISNLVREVGAGPRVG
jgi:hypothetical protein